MLFQDYVFVVSEFFIKVQDLGSILPAQIRHDKICSDLCPKYLMSLWNYKSLWKLMIVSEKGSGLGWTAVTPPPQIFFFFLFIFPSLFPLYLTPEHTLYITNTMLTYNCKILERFLFVFWGEGRRGEGRDLVPNITVQAGIDNGFYLLKCTNNYES